MIRSKRVAAVVAWLGLGWVASIALAQEERLSDAELIARVSGGIVIVEHTYRYDNGEAPETVPVGMAYRGAEADMEPDWSSLITQERAGERQGYVIAPDLVLTVDPLVHPRFIEKIRVRAGDQRVGARPEAIAVEENAMLLRLDEPLEGVEPLRFDPAAGGPWKAVVGRFANARWWLAAGAIDAQTIVATPGPRYHVVTWPSLIVGADGTPVSACFDGGLEVDGAWRRSPADWEWVDAGDFESATATVRARADAMLPRVELRFRSPSQASPQGPWGWEGGGYDEEFTEWNGTGVLLDERRVLVLAQLKPKVTARLESVHVHFGEDGGEIGARFVGSLRDYAALVVELEEPAPGAAELSERTILDIEDELMVRAQVRVLGESRTTYLWQARLARMTRAFRNHVFGYFGDVSAGDRETGDGQEGPVSFLFSREGELVALPLTVREKGAAASDWEGSGWSRSEYESTVIAACDLREILGEGGAGSGFDPDNRPLSESEEHRLAWLGVELQAMDADLARFNGVVEQTSGGETGGIVTYVYPGSPAAGAGLMVGDVLLRLHIEGQPRPLEVMVSPYDMGWGEQFLEALDQVDPSYFDQIPPPWGSAETMLTRALTDVGFGTPYTAEVFRDGEILRPEFVVEEGPAHFGAAAKFKSEAAGLTVKDMTYEARRFFQLAPGEPGVIVSKVEQGERAAVAGIKPYELIVSVNDEPVHSVKEFEEATRAGGELRFSVMRMHMGRIVKVRVPGGE